jgi:hypothetical protein
VRRAASLLAALFIAPATGLAAQAGLHSSVGQRVRLTTDADSHWLVGTLVGADEDSVRLRTADSAPLVSVARSRVTQFEVRYRGHSNAGRGALIGFGVGAISGGLWGLADASNCKSPSWCIFSPGQEALGGGLLLGGAGALLGAVIGAVTQGGGWEAVSLSGAHVALAPRGAGLALSLTF